MSNKKNGKKPQASTDLSGVRQAISSSTPPSIIHHRGQLNQVTVDGKTITRQEKIYLPGMQVMVSCAPYDDHFVFYDASRMGWTTFCTCGSPAVVTGYDGYKRDASPQGALLICKIHADTGNHNPVNK